MRSGLEATLPWWIAGPVLGLVIVTLLGLANRRFGVVGGSPTSCTAPPKDAACAAGVRFSAADVL